MAKVKLPSYLISIDGRIGDMVYYRAGKTICARRYVVPENPRSASQQSQRSLFAAAMAAWKLLCEDEKMQFRKRARRLSMRGHNLFIREYIKSERSNSPSGITEKPLTAGTPDFRGTGHYTLRESFHVKASPFDPCCNSISPYLLLVYTLYASTV